LSSLFRSGHKKPRYPDLVPVYPDAIPIDTPLGEDLIHQAEAEIKPYAAIRTSRSLGRHRPNRGCFRDRFSPTIGQYPLNAHLMLRSQFLDRNPNSADEVEQRPGPRDFLDTNPVQPATVSRK
jgi:hypothetical protein